MSERREEIILEISTPYATILLRKDGITEIVFVEEYLLDLDDIRVIQDAIDSIEQEEPLFILVIPGPQGGITTEAREAPMFKSESKAIAIVTKMLHQRILGNIFFKFKKAKFENYKLFKERKKAEEWLKSEMSVKT